MILSRGGVGRLALISASIGAIALAFSGAMLAPEARSQAVEPVPAVKVGEQATATVACITCHGAIRDHEAEHPFGKAYKSHEFILLNEGVTWPRDDPHSMAFKVLDCKLGKSMAVKLDYDVTSKPECLNCHATDHKPAARVDGVSCAGCHGTGTAWQFDHYLVADGKLAWRTMPAAAKKAKGLGDLRNPVVKAELCVSCHVGDVAKKRVVTHQMYAAGHPPLPPFELSTYQSGQPRHWAHPTQLKYFEDFPAKDRWNHFRFHPPVDRTDGESAVARDHAAGAIAALRAEAALLEAAAIDANSEKASIDFARFDCYACHHDLKSPSDRPKRGEGKPGRPPLRASIGLSAGIVAEHALASGNADLKKCAQGFTEKWKALQAAALARPFGDSEKVRESAHAVVEWCNAFLEFQRTCSVPLYSMPETQRLAEMIRTTAEGEAAADPESALVLTWAYLNLADELQMKVPDDAVKGIALPRAVRSSPFAESGNPAKLESAARAMSIRKFEADPFRKVFGKLLPIK